MFEATPDQYEAIRSNVYPVTAVDRRIPPPSTEALSRAKPDSVA